MTVNESETLTKYTGDGTQKTFPVQFKYLADTDLAVALRLDGESIDTQQQLGPHYSVDGVGSENGGDVIFVTAPPLNAEIAITRNMDFEQQTDYVAGDPFPAESHETALDRIVMMLQQLRDETNRAIKALPTSETDPTTTFPDPDGTIDWLLGFNTSKQLDLFDPAVLSPHGTSAPITDHSDVLITVRDTGDILVDDGTKYVNLARGSAGQVLASTGTTVAYKTPALNDNTDVTITGTPADNEVLAYDTGTGDFINQTAAEAGISGGQAFETFVSAQTVTVGASGNHWAVTGAWDEIFIREVSIALSSGTGSADADFFFSRTDSPAVTASADWGEHWEFFEAVDLSGGTGQQFVDRGGLDYVDDDGTGEIHFYLFERVAGTSPVYTATITGWRRAQ